MGMRLSIVSIDKLRNLGLRLSDEPSFGADHLAYPLGYTVMKPIGVGGNSVPSLRQCYEAGYAFVVPAVRSRPVAVVRYASATHPVTAAEVFLREK